MSPSQGIRSDKNPMWSVTFWNRVHRYRCLMAKYWWVLALTLSLAVFAAAVFQANQPVRFASMAQTRVDQENISKLSFGAQTNSEFGPQAIDDFMATERKLILGTTIPAMAAEKFQARYPDMPHADTKLNVVADGPIFTFTAMGPTPQYAQRYLQSVVDAYLDFRGQQKHSASGDAMQRVNEQRPIFEDKLKVDDAALIQFQRDHPAFAGRGKNTGPAAELEALKTRLNQITDEYNQFSLMTPDQGLERAPGSAASPQAQAGLETSSAEGDYRGAQETLVRLQATMDDLSHDLRPKHPKIIALRTQIDAQNKIIASLLDRNRKRIQNQRELRASMIQSTKEQIAQAEPRAQADALLQVEYDKLEETKARDLKTYNDLQTTLNATAMQAGSDVDPVRVVEPASTGAPVPSAWLKMMALALIVGTGAGLGILVLIDRMDDRMSSIGDFQAHFADHVLGQIPRDTSKEQTELLKPDDQRHQLVESFRNLRSTLLYMPLDGTRPKTLLITSAIPNEGKSTLSCNLALVMASAGMKTLLIDGDLRRGEIHNAFGVTRDPGFTDVLGHSVNWKIAIRTTGVENLHVLPRGRNVPQPSEYLLSKNTDRLLQELYPMYDYIIIDSSPVLAADDTASLAPKIDATLFVVRMSFTPAKMTRKSLDILHGRQANIPGLILNQVDTRSPEFVYYQYSEYYHAMPPEDGDDGGSKKGKAAKPPIEVS